MCQHNHVIRHGFDRKGVRRVLCKDCGITWVAHNGWGAKVNRLSPSREAKLAALMALGKTDRQIRKQLGVAHITIVRRRAMWSQPVADPAKVKGLYKCDYCGGHIHGEREAFRKTRRTTHKFCQRKCYDLFQRAKTGNDVCKRCKRKRKDIGLCVVFSNGLCPHCYQLLRSFDGNEEAAALFETNQRLKKEIRRAERKAQKP